MNSIRFKSRKGYSVLLSVSVSLTTLLLLSCALSTERSMASAGPDIDLRFSLEARETYVIGRPVTITFTLENLSDTPIYVLTWYTPLEGLKGKIFRVKRNGTNIPYEGRMVKRGSPEHNDYVRIVPRSSVSAQVDLSLSYGLALPGEYHVEFVGRIHDVAHEGVALPRPQETHQGMSIQGNAVTFRMIRN